MENREQGIKEHFDKIRHNMSEKAYRNKKYTPEALEKKIDAYFIKCESIVIKENKKKFFRGKRMPYTLEHLALHLNLRSHEMVMYATDESFKDFHAIIERAYQRIIGDWIVKGLLGEYNVSFLKFLLPHISLYKETFIEEERIGRQELTTITIFHDEDKPKELEDKKTDYIDAEIRDDKKN